MANQHVKTIEIMFEEYVESFDASCVVSQNAAKFRPEDKTMQRAGDVIYRPQRYHADLLEGLDLTGKRPTDIVERLVPSAYKEPQNVLWTLDAREMRNPEYMKEMGRAAAQRIAAKIDSDLINTAGRYATNVVTVGDNSTGTLGKDLWNSFAELDALMTSIGIPAGVSRRAFLNAFSYKDIAGELAGRAYSSGINQSAFEKAKIPDIASFDAYKTDISPRLGAGPTGAITLTAAPAHKVVSKNANDIPVDNRQGVIAVSAGHGLEAGDAFTIAGVHSVHQISKDTTDYLQTFRVLEVSGNNITITPQILPPDNADLASRPYSNVDANAASGAALTVINKVAANANLAWADGSVELMWGNLAFPSDMGPKVMRSTTKQGATLIMSYDFNHISGACTARFTTLYGTTVLVPEYVGLVLPKQPA
ncbi:major head protein [Escherichia phage Sortsne]|uniref:Coat protein n=1 Tax=Escherichia phage Sortsne TaxID=2562456 RepID=A0A4D6DZC4_9CAUD|nr:major head protein [Escherichia phage Sortsne]QBZ71605.1 coat protein [Escherichia phage Sortsne]QHJ80400.1 MAG: hypothetical protein [Bacteriophage sp.]